MIYKDGDIVLVKVNKFSVWYRWLFAQLIRFFDGVYYHHAQIVFDGLLFEANDHVLGQNFDYNEGDEIIILRLKQSLTRTERQALSNLIAQSISRKYDYWGAMFHQLIYILTFRRIWIGKRKRKADYRPYCTEFVTSLMHQVRGYFPDHYKIGPSELIKRAALYYEVVYEGKA